MRTVEFLELLNAAVVANSFAAASHGVQDLTGAETRERPLTLGRVRIAGGDFELIEGPVLASEREKLRAAWVFRGRTRAEARRSRESIPRSYATRRASRSSRERCRTFGRVFFAVNSGSTWLTSSERRPASLGHDDGRGRGPCGLQSFASRTPRVRKQSPPWFYSKGRKTLGSPPSKDRNRVRLCDPKLVFTSYGAGCHITAQPTSRPLQAATAPKLRSVSASLVL